MLKALDQLDQLDENLTKLETTFDMHFAAATPEVKGHMDSLVKAIEGLKTAKMVLDGLNKLVATFPEDKGAAKAKVEAERMVDRFEKHIEKTRKIVRTLSAKAMPKALKDLGAKIEKIIKAKLVNPSVLEVLPWQDTQTHTAPYLIFFRIQDKSFHNGRVEVRIEENISSTDGPSLYDGYNITRNITADKAAEAFFAKLRGWDGIKGGAEEKTLRKMRCVGIEGAIKSITNSLGWMTDPPTVSDDYLTVEGSYRAGSLPKEGAYELGEYEYEQLVMAERAKCQKAVDAKLAPYKDVIKNTEISFGEKSWVYITVHLK
jgi:hypothetical protein